MDAGGVYAPSRTPVPWIRHGLIRPASSADSPSSFSSFLLPAHLQLQPWPSSSSRDFSRLPGKVERVCSLDVKMFIQNKFRSCQKASRCSRGLGWSYFIQILGYFHPRKKEDLQNYFSLGKVSFHGVELWECMTTKSFTMASFTTDPKMAWISLVESDGFPWDRRYIYLWESIIRWVGRSLHS